MPLPGLGKRRLRTGHQTWRWEAILDQIVHDKGDDSQNGVSSRQEGAKEVEKVSMDNSGVLANGAASWGQRDGADPSERKD